MGRHYCDYCDIYLTHDSLNVRKAHNSGRNHQQNVVQYFMSLGTDQTQEQINRIQRQYEGGPSPMGGMGMGMGMMGGPPVMRSAGPPGFMPQGGMGMMPQPNFNGPPSNFNAPPSNFPPYRPPQNFMNGGAPPPPHFSQQQQRPPPPPPPPQFQPSSNGIPDGMGGGQQGFTNAPPQGMGAPAAASGPARPMVNPDRMRMMGGI